MKILFYLSPWGFGVEFHRPWGVVAFRCYPLRGRSKKWYRKAWERFVKVPWVDVGLVEVRCE